MFTRSLRGVPDPVTSHFHTRWYPVRIGLFTEQDSGAHGRRAATVDALIAHRPHDASIIEYSRPGNLKDLLCAREMVDRAAADRIDLVHVATSGPLAIVALLVASSLGLPLIGSFQPQAPATSGLFRAYLRALVRQTRRLLVSSMTARATWIGADISTSKIVLWRPGVDTVMFAPSKRSSGLRERWGVSDARPAVICVGELSGERGAHRLLSMEVALHRTRPMHQLIVAGEGPNRNELQARCPNAIFMGAVPHAALPEVLASGDLFVCPSDAISTNLAVLEAQASGLPVVVMAGGSAHERVTESTGCVCRSNADFIVEAASLVRTEERRRAMGLAARVFARHQEWGAGLTAVYAEYRSAAEISRVRRNLEPAFIPQGRRL
jgi:glycosyltransferase involved in cell wall biosynthesis